MGSPSLFSDVQQFLNYSWLHNCVVGFSISEGSFGIKCNNDAFYSIRQTGIENCLLIQAIYCTITGVVKDVKPDEPDSCQAAVQSKKHIQSIINLFSFSN